MTLVLKDSQINEIAGLVEAGFKCYYDIHSKEIKEIPDVDPWMMDDEEEIWKKELEEIDKNREAFIDFAGMSSRESYQVMVDFTEKVASPWLRERLIEILERSKPFRHFKQLVDAQEEERQAWFDFRNQTYIKKVKERIEHYNEFEREE